MMPYRHHSGENACMFSCISTSEHGSLFEVDLGSTSVSLPLIRDMSSENLQDTQQAIMHVCSRVFRYPSTRPLNLCGPRVRISGCLLELSHFIDEIPNHLFRLALGREGPTAVENACMFSCVPISVCIIQTHRGSMDLTSRRIP